MDRRAGGEFVMFAVLENSRARATAPLQASLRATPRVVFDRTVTVLLSAAFTAASTRRLDGSDGRSEVYIQ